MAPPPAAGLTVDAAGKFYGTSNGVESGSNGTVFKLTSGGSGWTLAPLNNFHQGGGGARPDSKVAIGPNGNLFGVTYLGGQGDCVGNGSCGVVYELQPPPRACASFLCSWTQIVLHQFNDLPMRAFRRAMSSSTARAVSMGQPSTAEAEFASTAFT